MYEKQQNAADKNYKMSSHSTAYKPPKIDMPKFDIPKFDMPKF